uniref:Uncharacterized protein n=1 Tax=Romanomermis culicivorax TaxID=13658 RepID=A0A915I6H8_ROMCU
MFFDQKCDFINTLVAKQGPRLVIPLEEHTFVWYELAKESRCPICCAKGGNEQTWRKNTKSSESAFLASSLLTATDAGAGGQQQSLSKNGGGPTLTISTQDKKPSKWRLLAFLFSHIGLCALVVGYAILGAVMFRAIELPEEMKHQGHIKNDTQFLSNYPSQSSEPTKIVDELLRYTNSHKFLRKNEWKDYADKLLKDYEVKMVHAVNFEGYDGNDDVIKYQWTYFGALLYSITVFTTIAFLTMVALVHHTLDEHSSEQAARRACSASKYLLDEQNPEHKKFARRVCSG